MPKFKHVILLSDDIRGHYHQSLGIAEWLERLCGAHIEQIVHVPKLSGLQKFLTLKLSARKLATNGADYAQKWLKKFGVAVNGIENDTLFISAGSSAAPFTLALAKATGNKSAVVMTPSVLGTKPFDFAIIPDHDFHDSSAKNIFTTLGAPNHIYIPDLPKIGDAFFKGKDFTGEKVLVVLVGGSDANYNMTPEWAEDTFGPLRYIDGIKILLSSSRRTGEAVDKKLASIFDGLPTVEYMILISQKPNYNSVTALLGKATHVLATDDSVSMVSEAVTAGFKVGLLRVPRFEHKVKEFFGYGAKRFDEMFDKMLNRKLIEDLGDKPDLMKFLEPPEQKHNIDYNEAKRAAEWIISK